MSGRLAKPSIGAHLSSAVPANMELLSSQPRRPPSSNEKGSPLRTCTEGTSSGLLKESWVGSAKPSVSGRWPGPGASLPSRETTESSRLTLKAA